MAKCPGCNKFASYSEEPEVTVDDANFDDGNVTGSVTVNLTSACCGDNMKEGSIDFEIEVIHPSCDDCSECDIEVEDFDAENCTSEVRGRKTIFLADITVTLKCPCKKQDTFTVTTTIEIDPAELDEC